MGSPQRSRSLKLTSASNASLRTKSAQLPARSGHLLHEQQRSWLTRYQLGQAIDQAGKVRQKTTFERSQMTLLCCRAA